MNLNTHPESESQKAGLKTLKCVEMRGSEVSFYFRFQRDTLLLKRGHT